MTESEFFISDEMSRENPRRRRESIRRFGFMGLRALRSIFPEGAARNFVRAQILKYKQNIPRELMFGPGDFVVQVGTPQTETLGRISKSLGNHGKALIIEADVDNVQRLREYAASNNLKNVIIENYAADHQPGQVEFLVSKKWCGNHRIADETVVNDNDQLEIVGTGTDYLRRVVEADTVQAICQRNGFQKIDYIEIAVNGAELRVLKGMEKILENTSRLFVKGHSRIKGTGLPLNVEIRELLAKYGFRLFLTRTARSHGGDWGDRDGDVYAWR